MWHGEREEKKIKIVQEIFLSVRKFILKTQRLKRKLDKSSAHLHTANIKVHFCYTTIHPSVVQEGLFDSSFPVDSLLWCLPKRTSRTSHVIQRYLIILTIFAENSELWSSVLEQLETGFKSVQAILQLTGIYLQENA